MKRVYKRVSVERVESGSYTIQLDGKRIMTPAKRNFIVSSERLARAIAGEWDSQQEEFAPETMKLTQFMSTALDIVEPNPASVVEELLKFLATDLVCYRAEEPHELMMIQEQRFEPLLIWFEEKMGEPLVVTRGVMPATQPESLMGKIRPWLEAHPPGILTALQIAASLTASLVIPMALIEGRLTSDEAFEAGFVDEIFQVRRWGEDKEATHRLDAARHELAAVQKYLYLIS